MTDTRRTSITSAGGYEDFDLAAQITVAYERGVVLFGKALREQFPPIDKSYFVQSIVADIEHAQRDIIHSPVYFILNLCRVLLYLREGVVASKQEGGEWGLKALPAKYRSIVRCCLDDYAGTGIAPSFDSDGLTDFAGYMLEEVHNEIDHIQ
ncbi:DUF4111 domain-containing protein [Paenibacillus pinihumi]|uniref:DUF4111 domain-containing protein n=1 Tax=Paenibacillus pinihumi TaxID=669462 RepID=UPI0004120FC9|nr:DUF4111 domain-containing protein [Paenibacillus pinihumi]